MITFTKAHIIDNTHKSVDLLPNGVGKLLYPVRKTSTTFLNAGQNFLEIYGSVPAYNKNIILDVPISIKLNYEIPTFLGGAFLVVWHPDTY